MMDEQDLVKHFSQMIWKEAGNSVKENIAYDGLQNDNRSLLLIEGGFYFAGQFLSHYFTAKFEKDISLNENNAIMVNLDKKEEGDILCIRSKEKCLEVCQLYNIKNIVVIKPHIHSLDSLHLEVLLYDIGNQIKSYVYAYEADELYMIIDAERHVKSLQLFWNMLEWFEKSELKQKYIKELENSGLD